VSSWLISTGKSQDRILIDLSNAIRSDTRGNSLKSLVTMGPDFMVGAVRGDEFIVKLKRSSDRISVSVLQPTVRGRVIAQPEGGSHMCCELRVHVAAYIVGGGSFLAITLGVLVAGAIVAIRIGNRGIAIMGAGAALTLVVLSVLFLAFDSARRNESLLLSKLSELIQLQS
jgi:hypothetical protein